MTEPKKSLGTYIGYGLAIVFAVCVALILLGLTVKFCEWAFS